jgi:hypothetical protein
MQYKLQFCSIKHVHYTPFRCGKTLLKFLNFEFLNVHILNFQSFRIPHFLNCELLLLFNRLLSFHIFYHQLIFII